MVLSAHPLRSVATFEGDPVRLNRVVGCGDCRPVRTVQERLEEQSYMADPSAFWLRPDGDYLSDEPYRPKTYHYDVACDWTVELTYINQE